MYYTIALILLILWLATWLGLHIVSAFVHILFIMAIVALVMGLLKKTKT